MTDPSFIRACRGERTERTPIWLMRQIGRYQKSYRELRKKIGFLELCKSPDLVAEISASTARQLGVDAAIIFSDILLIAEPMGFSLEFVEGKGPVIGNPFRAAADLRRVRPAQARESLSFVHEAVRLARRDLPPEIPLIGFSGAPFTLAAYLIEGGGSKTFHRALSLMESDPDTWSRLLSLLSEGIAGHLRAQIEAGARAVQLFDTWVGLLKPEQYRRHVAPPTRTIFGSLPKEVPAIHFGVKTGPLLEEMKAAGGTVMGLDSHISLSQARRRLGAMPVQGNLDPAILLASGATIEREAGRVLEEAGEQGGHIFNLGHGVLPETPEENVRHLVDFVHGAGRRGLPA